MEALSPSDGQGLCNHHIQLQVLGKRLLPLGLRFLILKKGK
jgi:hypothetical protein